MPIDSAVWIARIFTPFKIFRDQSGFQILSALLHLCLISLTPRSYFSCFRNSTRVSLGIACNRFLCYLVTGFTGIFPNLVRVNGSDSCLNSFLCLLELLRNSSVSLITCSARSNCEMLVSVLIPKSSCRSRGVATTFFPKGNCSISRTGVWYALDCIRRLSMCVASPSVSPITEAIHQTLCTTKIYWFLLA